MRHRTINDGKEKAFTTKAQRHQGKTHREVREVREVREKRFHHKGTKGTKGDVRRKT
jgi:hypothetical protein